MILAALNTLIFEIFPFQLFDAVWQLKLIGQILGVIMPVLVGFLLIHLAAAINTKNSDLYENAKLARRVALWTALLLFLLIPLQFMAGASVVRQFKKADKDEITSIRQFTARLRLTQTEQQMRALAGSIANPPVLPEKLAEPFIKVRDDWATRLTNKVNQKEDIYAKKYNLTWQKYLADSVRNSIQCLLFGTALFTIGQRPGRNDKIRETIEAYTGREDAGDGDADADGYSN